MLEYLTFNSSVARTEMISKRLFSLLVVFLLNLLIQPAYSGFPVLDYITIKTKSGLVKGQVIRDGEGNTATQFLGLPFARPPLNNLRFCEPIKHSGWAFEQQALDATLSKPHCHPAKSSRLSIELGLVDDFKDEPLETSEDCLYVDIHVPGNLGKVSDISSLKLPVLVEVGNMGSGSTSFNKRIWHLLRMGDIIVVNVAYRQGLFGYFLPPSDGKNVSSSLNVGLLDQRLGIHWVWDNILAYGGNPDDITLLGQGEAAVYVWLHMTSPHISGLILRVISHGPTIASPGFILPRSHVVESSQRLVAHLGCNASSADVRFCMCNKTAAELLEGVEGVGGEWGVSWNEEVVGNTASLMSGIFASTTFLIGTAVKYGQSCESPKFSSFASSSQTLKESMGEEIKRLYYYAAVQDSNPTEAIAATMLEYTKSCVGDGRSVLNDLRTDLYLRSAAERTARILHRAAHQVYLYEVPVGSSCVVHSSSPAVQQSAQLLLDQQQQLQQQQEQVWATWINFVHSGNPGGINGTGSNNDLGVVWSLFNEFNKHCTIIQASSTNNISSQWQQQLRTRRMSFWNDYMPHLMKADQGCVKTGASAYLTSDSETVSGTFTSDYQINIIIWSFIGVTVLLLVIIIILLVSLCATRSRLLEKQQLLHDYSVYSVGSSVSCWDSCCMRGGASSSETRRLRQLPYRDET